MRSPYRPAIDLAATNVGLDPDLVESVVWQESSGQADAFRFEPAYWERYLKDSPRWRDEEPRRVSSSYGLMQIMYPTAVDYGFPGPPEGLFDIPTNLALGCKILKALLTRYGGQVALALAAYNGGPGGIRRPIPIRYAQQVLKRYQRLQAGRALDA